MNNQIKILHVVHSLKAGGIATLVSSLIKLNPLSDSVHDLLLFDDQGIENKIPCRILSLTGKSNNTISKYKYILKVFSQYQYIFIHYFHPLIIIALFKSRRKCFLFQHGMALGRKNILKRNIKRICYSIIPWLINGKVLFASRYAFSKTRNRGIFISKKKSEFIPFGISMNSQPKAKACNDRKKNELIIGLAGRLDRVKRFDLFLEACFLYKGKRFLQINIAGEGPELAILMKIAQRIPNKQIGVNFSGFLSNMDAFYAGLDLFVLPSKGESFGLVVLEALHNRVPVLVFSDVGGPIEMIQNNITGFIIENRKEALGDFLNNLDQDISILEKVRNNLNTYDMGKYDIVNVRKNLELAAMNL